MLGVKVRVRVLGILRQAPEGGELPLDFAEAPTVREVMLRLMEASPGLRSLLWDDAVDSPTPNALILMNGVEVNNLQGLATAAGDGSEIVVLPVTHGG